MARRIQGAATSAILTLLFGSGSASARPNILFILADDVGAEAFGRYGGTSYSTPRIDTLADQGVRFTHAYATPLCTPSRVQLLTGQYNFRNYESFGWLSPSETTFAQVLRDAGYRTAIAGKWQLSRPFTADVDEGEPRAPDITPAIMRDSYGFDEYSLWQLNYRDYHNRYWRPKIDQNGNYQTYGWDDYGPDIYTAFLTNFMAQAVSDDVPFLAYYTMCLPHDPWVPTPDSTSGRSRTNHHTANFPDNIAYLDKLVGRLLDQLDALGIRDNTLVIFTSDNGTDPRITSQTTSGPVTGDKGAGTEYGTHVPFIADWGTNLAPSVSGRIVDFTDIFPTFLSVSGIPAPEGLLLDGKPLFGPDGAAGEDRTIAYLWYDCMKPGFETAEWARDSQYKLYVDGSFFDVSATPPERSGDNIPVGTGSPEAEAARVKLQAVLDYYASEQNGDNDPVLPAGAGESRASMKNSGRQAQLKK